MLDSERFVISNNTLSDSSGLTREPLGEPIGTVSGSKLNRGRAKIHLIPVCTAILVLLAGGLYWHSRTHRDVIALQLQSGQATDPAAIWNLSPFTVNTPSINTVETASEITVTATLNSLEAKDVSVRIQDNALVLSARQDQTDLSKADTDPNEESSLSSFQAAIPLPARVKTHEMKTTIENGILTVVIPKA